MLEDDSKIQEAISNLGPGGVPWDLIKNFGLSLPVLDPDDTAALVAHMQWVDFINQFPGGTSTPPHLSSTQVHQLG